MNIRVNLSYPIQDGTEVVFRSPVDCSQVTGLKVYYTEGENAFSKEFAFADAHGNNVGDIDHLFAENVVVKVILDVTAGMAFVQNADTNAYLEGRFAESDAMLDKVLNCLPSVDFTDTKVPYTVKLVQANCDNTGAFSASSKRVMTDFIPIGQGIIGVHLAGADELFWVRLFDENKTYIGNGSVAEDGTMGFATANISARYDRDIIFDSITQKQPNVKYAVVVFRKGSVDEAYTTTDVKMTFTIPGRDFVVKPLNEVFLKIEDYEPADTEAISSEVAYIGNNLSKVISSFPSGAYESIPVEYDSELEQGACDTVGAFSDSTKRVRTGYIPIGQGIVGVSLAGADELFWVRLFDENKSFLGNGSVAADGTMKLSTSSLTERYMDIVFDSVMVSSPHVKYAVVVFKTSSNTVIAPSDIKMTFTIPEKVFVGKSLDDLYVSKGRKAPYSADELVFWYDISHGYQTKGFLKLPPNYTADGKPVPLIVFVHGSGDITHITMSGMTQLYDDYYNYLRDCGYAIFDCFGWGTKYNTDGGGNTFGAPTNRDCYRSGIKYVCDTYNIDERNIFVACKSLGGLQAFSMYYDPLIPVNAVGMLAPELDMFKSGIGYNPEVRRIVAQELGFTDEPNNVLGWEKPDSPTTEFYDYLEENTEKWCGIFNIFTGLPIKNADKRQYYGVWNAFKHTGDMCRHSLGRPLKIWCADDDSNVNPNTIKAVVSSLNNGGYIAQYRSMGTDTGGHHAVDNDANAPQTLDVTTKCGIHYDTIPTAYYELAQWFDTWLTK